MTDLSPTFDSFRLHDEQGLPLTVTLTLAKQNNIHVNLAAFACDALYAGWTPERLRTTLEQACADSQQPFSWEQFNYKLAALWTVVGKGKPIPECWQAMKTHITEYALRKLKPTDERTNNSFV